jgi:hypothetical protein
VNVPGADSSERSPGDALGLVACEIFLAYLAGVPTTTLAARYRLSAPRVNRTIKRTATSLLELTGGHNERRMPPHLNRLRNEGTLWVFRLAMVMPERIATLLPSELDESQEAEAVTVYRHLYLSMMAQRQHWNVARPHSDPGHAQARAPREVICQAQAERAR